MKSLVNLDRDAFYMCKILITIKQKISRDSWNNKESNKQTVEAVLSIQGTKYNRANFSF